MKLIFCLQINIKGFLKLIVSFQVCVARHAKITQNNKLAISLQYLKKKVSDEVEFLHADKHESFLQVNTMILNGNGKSFPKIAKQQVCNVFTITQKEVRDEVDFLHANKSLLQVNHTNI